MGFLDFIPVIGQAVSGIAGIGSTSMANQQNMEIAKYNWEQQKEMWHMQNDYNKPSAQMARYQEAGLNPNLIYGSGSASAGNSTSIPTPQMAHVEPMPVPQLGDSLQQAVNNMRADKLADAEVANKESLSRYNDVKAEHESVMMGLTELRAIGQAIDNAKSDTERNFLVDTYQSRVNTIQEQLEGQRLGNDSSRLDNFYNSATMETRIELAKVQTRNAKAMTQEIMSRTSLNYANAKLAAARINEIAANVVLINRKSYGQMIDNSFKTANFNTELSKASQELFNICLSGDKQAMENFFRRNGIDVTEHAPLVNSAFGLLRAASNKSHKIPSGTYSDYK
nr:MAG TPA: DNA pilot protein VP2 [Microviridae sp.]